MPVTIELSPLSLEPSAILRLARQQSKKLDNLSRDELIDKLIDVGEAIRQQAIRAKTTIEDIPGPKDFKSLRDF